MKVTVCFANNVSPQGHDKIVVPCGEGGITVGELANRAALRYNRNFVKEENSSSILFLKTLSSNALLDSEDYVKDVIDNNDLLVACFNEEQYYEGGGGTDQVSEADSLSDISPLGEEYLPPQVDEPLPSEPVSLDDGIQPISEPTNTVDLVTLLNIKGPLKELVSDYQCGVCFETFPDNKTLIKHQDTHEALSLLKCPKCPRFFASQSYLDLHLRFHNRAVRRSALPPYAGCPICGKVLKNQDSLKRHLQVHADCYHLLKIMPNPCGVFQEIMEMSHFGSLEVSCSPY